MKKYKILAGLLLLGVAGLLVNFFLDALNSKDWGLFLTGVTGIAFCCIAVGGMATYLFNNRGGNNVTEK